RGPRSVCRPRTCGYEWGRRRSTAIDHGGLTNWIRNSTPRLRHNSRGHHNHGAEVLYHLLKGRIWVHLTINSSILTDHVAMFVGLDIGPTSIELRLIVR